MREPLGVDEIKSTVQHAVWSRVGHQDYCPSAGNVVVDLNVPSVLPNVPGLRCHGVQCSVRLSDKLAKTCNNLGRCYSEVENRPWPRQCQGKSSQGFVVL